MVKQFLLNPDGSIPDGANLVALMEAGVTLVIPTDPISGQAGMIVVDGDPEQREDGLWYQTWKLVPEETQVVDPVEPDPPPAPDIVAVINTLTDEQKRALIALLQG